MVTQTPSIGISIGDNKTGLTHITLCMILSLKMSESLNAANIAPNRGPFKWMFIFPKKGNDIHTETTSILLRVAWYASHTDDQWAKWSEHIFCQLWKCMAQGLCNSMKYLAPENFLNSFCTNNGKPHCRLFGFWVNICHWYCHNYWKNFIMDFLSVETIVFSSFAWCKLI